MKDLVDMIDAGSGKKGKRKSEGPVPLTKDLVLSIEDAITMKIALKDQQATVKDHISGLAKKLNVTTGEMNSIIANIMASREDETKMDEKKKALDFVEEYKEFKEKNF